VIILEPCKYEREIIDTGKTLAAVSEQISGLDRRINGSFEKINRHIEDGKGWRLAIAGTIVAVIIQIIVIAYYAGKFAKLAELYEKTVVQVIQGTYAQGGVHNGSGQPYAR
jgi:hypothetical protein